MLAEALPVTIEEVIKLKKYKTKAYKKKSMRERQRIEASNGVSSFGRLPSGRQRIAFNQSVHKFLLEGTCRHGRSLANPCIEFDANAEGNCKLGGGICDLVKDKGERYLREFEGNF